MGAETGEGNVAKRRGTRACGTEGDSPSRRNPSSKKAQARSLVARAGKDFSKRSPPSLYDSWLKCRESARKKEETRGKGRERESGLLPRKRRRARSTDKKKRGEREVAH